MARAILILIPRTPTLSTLTPRSPATFHIHRTREQLQLRDKLSKLCMVGSRGRKLSRGPVREGGVYVYKDIGSRVLFWINRQPPEVVFRVFVFVSVSAVGMTEGAGE